MSLINYIGSPLNYSSKNMLTISDSGVNINPKQEFTTTMDPVIISNNMTERLQDGTTMELSHIGTIQLPVLSKQAGQIHISRKLKYHQ